ncbi:MAG: hypothetical protein ABIN36_18970 [Ferruginibacter sp.]
MHRDFTYTCNQYSITVTVSKGGEAIMKEKVSNNGCYTVPGRLAEQTTFLLVSW